MPCLHLKGIGNKWNKLKLGISYRFLFCEEIQCFVYLQLKNDFVSIVSHRVIQTSAIGSAVT